MKVLVIGCGAMGSAFARGLAEHHELTLHDRTLSKATALAKETSSHALEALGKHLHQFEVVLLAVKPKDLSAVAEEIAPFLSDKALLVSILTGTSLETLESRFPGVTLLRAMPSLSIRCKRGVLALAEPKTLSPAHRKRAEELLEGMGLAVWLPESKLDAVTSLNSGPGIVALLLEAMIDAGVLMGFSSREAKEYMLEMVEGTLVYLRQEKLSPSELKREGTSPAGTTIHALKKLEEGGTRAALMNAFQAAHDRAKAIAKETSGKREGGSA